MTVPAVSNLTETSLLGYAQDHLAIAEIKRRYAETSTGDLVTVAWRIAECFSASKAILGDLPKDPKAFSESCSEQAEISTKAALTLVLPASLVASSHFRGWPRIVCRCGECRNSLLHMRERIHLTGRGVAVNQ